MFTLNKEQEKVIVAFTQGHDVFVALQALARASATVVCRTFLTNFEVSRTLWWVSPGGEW